MKPIVNISLVFLLAISAIAASAEPRSVCFTVTAKKGELVADVKKEDVKLYEDGKIQTIANFADPANQSVSMILMLDVSGSSVQSVRGESAALVELATKAIRPGKDTAAVILFDAGVTLQQDFTGDVRKITAAIDKARAAGGTAFYDAALLAADHLSKAPERRVVVVAGDGEDNSSRFTFEQMLGRLQNNDVAMYALVRSSGFRPSREADDARNALKKAASQTGGAAFFPSNPQDFDAGLKRIADELHAQYCAGYTSDKAPGKSGKIRIDFANKDYTAHHR